MQMCRRGCNVENVDVDANANPNLNANPDPNPKPNPKPKPHLPITTTDSLHNISTHFTRMTSASVHAHFTRGR